MWRRLGRDQKRKELRVPAHEEDVVVVKGFLLRYAWPKKEIRGKGQWEGKRGLRQVGGGSELKTLFGGIHQPVGSHRADQKKNKSEGVVGIFVRKRLTARPPRMKIGEKQEKE